MFEHDPVAQRAYRYGVEDERERHTAVREAALAVVIIDQTPTLTQASAEMVDDLLRAAVDDLKAALKALADGD